MWGVGEVSMFIVFLFQYLVPCFPDGASGKEPACQCRRFKRWGFDPWVGKIPWRTWRRTWQPTPVFLPEKSHDRGAWQTTVHRVAQSQTRLKWLSTHACSLLIVCAFSLQNVTCLRFICAESAALIQSFLYHVDGHFGFLQLLLLQTKLNEHLSSYLLVTHERDSRYMPRRGMVGSGVHPDTSASRLNGTSEVMPQRPTSWEPRWFTSQETLCPGAGASTLTISDHDQSIQKLYPKRRIYGEGGWLYVWLALCVCVSVCVVCICICTCRCPHTPVCVCVRMYNIHGSSVQKVLPFWQAHPGT